MRSTPHTVRVSVENQIFQHLELLKRSQNARHRFQEFFVEGVKSISQAHRHGWTFRSLVYPTGHSLTSWARELLAAEPRAKRIELSPSLMEQLSDKHQPSELIATVAMPPDGPERLTHATDGPREPRDELLVAVVDRPSSPGNLGSIIRSCHALGAQGLIVTGHGTDVYNPLTVRASMGSLFALPVVRMASHREVGRWLTALGAAREASGEKRWIQLVGTGGDATLPVHTVDLKGPTVLVFGNEAKGLASGYRELCDVLVAIPMHGGADSINVACAAAILLYEADRQRRPRRPRRRSPGD